MSKKKFDFNPDEDPDVDASELEQEYRNLTKRRKAYYQEQEELRKKKSTQNEA